MEKNFRMNTLDRQYQNLVRDILENGVEKSDRTGTGTLSVFGRQIRHNMSEGFPALTTKKLAWKSVVTELLFFLRGETNIKYLLDNNCNIWNGDCYRRYVDKESEETTRGEYGETCHNTFFLSKEKFIEKIKTDNEFAKNWGDLGPLYPKQWRRWQGWVDMQGNEKGSLWFDQIGKLIQDLKTNPDDRGLLVSAWNVAELDEMVLRPCHYSWQVYTRELDFQERLEVKNKRFSVDTDDLNTEEKLDGYNIPKRAISLMFNMRSTDVPLGLPFNLASYGLLLEILAKEVNMVPDELIANLGDAHIYLNQIDGIKEQLGRGPFDLPSLTYKDEFHYLMDKSLVGSVLFSEKINKFKPDFFKLENYQCHPAIKLPLSN